MSVTRLSGGLTPPDGSDPRTFPSIWNNTAGQIETVQGQVSALQGTATALGAGLSSLGSTVVAQGVAISDVEAGIVSLESSTGGTATLDFVNGPLLVSHQVSEASVSVEALNYVPGSSRTVRFVGGTAVASLDLPNDWVFVGNAAGTAIGTAVTVVVTATSFGSDASQVVAAYAEEA